MTGNASFGGAVTNMTTLSVSGTSTISANITTSSTQAYTGAVTLAGGRTLTGSTVTFTSTVDGGANSLAVTGNACVLLLVMLALMVLVPLTLRVVTPVTAPPKLALPVMARKLVPPATVLLKVTVLAVSVRPPAKVTAPV